VALVPWGHPLPPKLTLLSATLLRSTGSPEMDAMNSAETARAEVSENISIAQYCAVSNGLTFFIFELLLAYSFLHFERTSLPYNNN